jgi:deoxyribonuclease (pyrimidine dimer)
MTRINLVPPSELADQHLFAEYREIKMIPRSLHRSLDAVAARQGSPIGAHGHAVVTELLGRLPCVYTLNAGHVSFFYDKGLYLAKRYRLLRHELRRRGIEFNKLSRLDLYRTFWTDERLCLDYTPTPEALALIRERIASRVAMKPHWYRWTNAKRPSL